MLAAQYPEKVKALVIEDAPLTLENYRKLIDASRDMFGLVAESQDVGTL